PESGRFIYKNHFLEVPLWLTNYFGKAPEKKLFLHFGLSPAYNFSNKIITVHYEEDSSWREVEENESTDYRSFNLNASLGLGWERRLSENMKLIICPNFKVNTLGISRDASLNRRVFLFGLRVGIRFK
ncbi:MAG: hypothetical protein DWQ02_01790, partial [Bacteroidetes bacterium]